MAGGSRIRILLDEKFSGGAAPGPVAPGGVRTSTPEVIAPLATGGMATGPGATPIDIVLFFVADQAGQLFIWQGNDPADFAGLPGVQPAATRTIVSASPFAMVANVPQTIVVPYAAPIVAVQYVNGGVIVNNLRLSAAVRYR